MHRVVISSIRNRPPEIGVYLGLLIVILRFLYSVRGLGKLAPRPFGASSMWAANLRRNVTIVVYKLLISSAL